MAIIKKETKKPRVKQEDPKQKVVCSYVCIHIYIYIYTHTHTLYIYIYIYTLYIYIYIYRERERERERDMFPPNNYPPEDPKQKVSVGTDLIAVPQKGGAEKGGSEQRRCLSDLYMCVYTYIYIYIYIYIVYYNDHSTNNEFIDNMGIRRRNEVTQKVLLFFYQWGATCLTLLV